MPANEKDLLNRIRDSVKAINKNEEAAKGVVPENEENEAKEIKPIPLRTAEEIAEEVRIANERNKG